MLQLHLFFEALVASWRAAPGVRRRALEQRGFPVHDGGCLVFRVPPDWREEIALSGARSTVAFRTPARQEALLRISMQPLSAQESAAFSIEKMRLEVEQAAGRAGRDGNAARMETLASRFGGGFHFSTLQQGRWLTQGKFLVRPVLLEFRIQTSPAEGRLHADALDLVRSARASSG